MDPSEASGEPGQAAASAAPSPRSGPAAAAGETGATPTASSTVPPSHRITPAAGETSAAPAASSTIPPSHRITPAAAAEEASAAPAASNEGVAVPITPRAELLPAASSLRTAVARVTCDGGVRGTAFLIDPQHALTALHVVGDRRARPPLLYSGVQLDFSGQLITATVVTGGYDPEADWALLRLQTPPRDAAGGPLTPLPLDELAEADLQQAEQAAAGLAFRSRGFPDANPDDGLDVGGQVRTTLGQVDGIRALQLFSHEAAAGTGAPVSGLSGAPVLVAGAVVGLLRTAILDGEGRAMAGTLFACPAGTVLAALQRLGEPVLQLPRLACPYPGMVAFARHQAGLFFGRSAEIDWLLQHVRKQSFALVLGPSGSGKSSLIHAGLLPRLPPDLVVRTMRPGESPDAELTTQLGGAGAPLLAALPTGQRLLLFIDQLEELFARCPHAVQQQFLTRLQGLRSDPRCVLLLSLRADFFPDLMSSQLWPIDPAQRLEVAPLRGAALAAAIAGPATQAGVRLEPALLERLVADAAEEPGALPLLQEALVLLWERRENRRLTLAAYEQLGRQAGGGEGPPRSGLAVAIASHAEAVFARLAPNSEQQRLARRIFVRLVHFGEGRPNTRRQLPRSALRAHGDDAALFSATLELLVSQRLLTQSSDEVAPTGEDAVRIDLSHEVILRAWPRLMRWIAEKKQAERIRRRLEDQASERLRLRKQGYGLLDAAETKEAEDWLAGPDAQDVGVSAAVAELIQDSHQAIRWEAAQAQRRWQLTAAVLLLVAGIAAGAALLAYQESNRVLLQYRLANEARQQALAKARTATARSLSALSRERLGRDADYDQALLLAVFGQRLQPSADSESSLLAALDGAPGLLTQLHGPDGRVSCLAVSPDGQLLATGGTDGLVQLFDARRGQLLGAPLGGHGGAITQVAFTVDSARLISAGTDGTLRVWDARPGTRGQPLGRPLTGHQGEITALAVSPDGKLVASGGSDDMTILLWDAVTGLSVGPPLRGHKKTVSGLAFSADGRQLASVSWDQTVRLWAPRSGQALPLALPKSDYPLRAVAFSPSGLLLAVGGGEDRGEGGRDSRTDSTPGPAAGVQLWSLEQPAPVARPLHSSRRSIISSLAFSPSGQQLAAGSWDKQVTVWSVSSGRHALRLRSPGGPILGLAYAPGGDWLATAAQASGPLLWSTRAMPALQLASTSSGEKLVSVAVSPDGRSIAAGGYDQAVHRFALAGAGLRETAALSGHKGVVYAVAFSPDGRRFASAGEDQLLRLWSTADNQPLGAPLTGHSALIYAVAFDPTGARLASGSFDGELRLWSADGRPQGEPLRGHSQAILGLGWSRDGTRLCSASQDISLRIWDAGSGAELAKVVKGHSLALTACAFTPDGAHVVTASEDSTLRVWTLRASPAPAPGPDARPAAALTLSPLGGPLGGHRGKVRQLAVTSDGRRILSVGEDQTLRLWDLATRTLIGTLGTAGGALTSVALLSDPPRAVTSAEDRTLRLWELDPSRWTRRACQRAGRDLDPRERELFVGGAEELTSLGPEARKPLCPPEPATP